jgi:hypothetical protein
MLASRHSSVLANGKTAERVARFVVFSLLA